MAVLNMYCVEHRLRRRIMNSLELISFKKTIKDYIDEHADSKEQARYVLKELLEEVSKESIEEAIGQANSREVDKKDGCI